MSDFQFGKAVDEVLEVVMFEHWVRFYFLREDAGKLFVSIPEEMMDAVKRDNPGFAPLAETLNGEEIDPEKSKEIVCTFVAARLDGQRFDPGLVESCFDSKLFKIGQYVFTVWAQSHEQYLDAGVKPFSEWQEMYENWRAMDEVQEYVAKLHAGAGAGEQSSDTIH